MHTVERASFSCVPKRAHGTDASVSKAPKAPAPPARFSTPIRGNENSGESRKESLGISWKAPYQSFVATFVFIYSVILRQRDIFSHAEKRNKRAVSSLLVAHLWVMVPRRAV